MLKIPEQLNGKICHTTTVSSFLSIFESGLILREPKSDLLQYTRYGSDLHHKQKSYVGHSLGGISVFDFQNFSLKLYDKYVQDTWEVLSRDLYRFVPSHSRNNNDGYSVWLIIDVNKCKCFINRVDLYDQWKKDKNVNGQYFIPNAEAAILEDVSVKCIQKVYIYDITEKIFLCFNLENAYNFLKDRF